MCEELISFYGGKYLIQVWNDKGNMVFQRALNNKIRTWGFSRHNNTFIYVLDPQDERDGGDYFHMVQLNFTEYISSKQANERKIKDWTGLCRDPKSINQMSFAIDA